ncbi:hypothetical protein C5B94_07020 [Clavibacter michiganensis]|nr:hypothetical protein C5B94_07020 [Clavibacter michiganensis]
MRVPGGERLDAVRDGAEHPVRLAARDPQPLLHGEGPAERAQPLDDLRERRAGEGDRRDVPLQPRTGDVVGEVGHDAREDAVHRTPPPRREVDAARIGRGRGRGCRPRPCGGLRPSDVGDCRRRARVGARLGTRGGGERESAEGRRAQRDHQQRRCDAVHAGPFLVARSGSAARRRGSSRRR